MSDATVKEATRQDGLARSYKDYLTAVIAFIVGWAVLWTGYGDGASSKLTMFIGWLIAGGPVFFGAFMTRSLDSLFPSYKVTTTYSDGSKESDHGAESSAAWLIGLVISFFLSGVIAILRIVWLTIKSIAYYIGVKEKPSLLLSPFPVLLLFLAGFVLAAVIPTQIMRARANALALDEPKRAEIDQGSILIPYRDSATIYAEADNDSAVVGEVNSGDTMTATGKIMEKEDDWDYIPVDHNGTTGWVNPLSILVYMPALATATVNADETVMYEIASAKKRYIESRSLDKGTLVNIIGEDKRGLTPIEFRAIRSRSQILRGFVKPEDITVQGGN